MDTIYHALGMAVFWIAVATVVIVLGHELLRSVWQSIRVARHVTPFVREVRSQRAGDIKHLGLKQFWFVLRNEFFSPRYDYRHYEGRRFYFTPWRERAHEVKMRAELQASWDAQDAQRGSENIRIVNIPAGAGER